MKKTALYCAAAALAIGFAGCSDDNTYGIPQINEQGAVFQSKDLVVYPTGIINVSELQSYDELVEVAVYSVTDLPAGYHIEGTFQLSSSEDYDVDVITVPITSNDLRLWASGTELANAYTKQYTKNPEPVQLHGRCQLYAVKDGEKMLLGGEGYYYSEHLYDFLPANPGYEVSTGYYLVPGDGSTWDMANAVEMKHSEADVYDDPNFSILVTKEIGKYWIVIPEKTYAVGILDGYEVIAPEFDRIIDGASHGDLVRNAEGKVDMSELVEIGIPTQIEINLPSMTYSQKAAYENYFVTGSGWPSWGAHWMPLSTTDYLNYYGFLNLGDQFKFAPQAGWGGDFGAANAPGEEESNGVYNYSGICKDSGDNIRINHPGLYFAHLNVENWSYDLKGINSWGLIGDFNGWGGDLEMTPSEDNLTWTAEFTSNGNGWKFRANGGWAINLGGSEDALWTNGDNITLPAGDYTITLDLSTYPAKFTAVKK